MRVDKWLKLARLIKRRTLAHDAADVGRVLINGKVAKPAAEVRVGDEIQVDIGGRLTRVRVLAAPERAAAAAAHELYELLSVEEKTP